MLIRESTVNRLIYVILFITGVVIAGQHSIASALWILGLVLVTESFFLLAIGRIGHWKIQKYSAAVFLAQLVIIWEMENRAFGTKQVLFILVALICALYQDYLLNRRLILFTLLYYMIGWIFISKVDEYFFASCFILFLAQGLIQLLQWQMLMVEKRLRLKASSVESLLNVVEAKKRVAQEATRAKTDFLANMSHEIRTPMNAIMGMVEMASREPHDEKTEGYFNQIRMASESLVGIVNDILDYSKLESGRMEIIPAEYEVLSLVNDVATIAMARRMNGEVKIFVDLNPMMAHRLYGDDIRIRQVLVNLVTNAIKFTKKGSITISLDYKEGENGIILLISVRDTGIGIKKKDLKLLFDAFQQVDMKRNRAIEGSGLGLSISKELVAKMNGEIKVESSYNEGSYFSFFVPQEVVDRRPVIELEDRNRVVYGIFSNEDHKSQCKKIMNKWKLEFICIDDVSELIFDDSRELFLIVEGDRYQDKEKQFFSQHSDLEGMILVDPYENFSNDLPNVHLVKEPLFIIPIAAILNHQDLNQVMVGIETNALSFHAPKANVLVVDDNRINLNVAAGLLEPLNMCVDLLESGAEAIQSIQNKNYDIIFMDHMMPEMDGVQVTRWIRKWENGTQNKIPIIALTANALSGAKEMFIKEGFTDFISKPIEPRRLIKIVRQWLPKDKIEPLDLKEVGRKKKRKSKMVIEGFDMVSAMSYLETEELFLLSLEDYYHSISTKADLMEYCLEQQDYERLKIELHSLKTVATLVGATVLSFEARYLEGCTDMNEIHEKLPPLLEQYRGQIAILKPFFKKGKPREKRVEYSYDQLHEILNQLKGEIEEFQIEQAEEVVKQLKNGIFNKAQKKLVELIDSTIRDFEYEKCVKYIDQLLEYNQEGE